jgi:hypothetical protein
MDVSRRNLLRLLAGLVVAESLPLPASGRTSRTRRQDRPKVIVVACGGVRRAETFSGKGLANIPHVHQDLLPRSIFFPSVRNDGVTSHFNTISSILTGNWQRVDDWGKTPPASPTIFEYLRRHLKLDQDDVWLISSNKALTHRIGASSTAEYGAPYGANVLFPKQLLINAVVNAAAQGRAAHTADRASMQPELAAMLEASNYEGLGWSVEGERSAPTAPVRNSMLQAIEQLVKTSAPVTGDEFTFLVATEVMRQFAPDLLVVTFSDVEVAHFGSYSLHLAGIRTLDRLLHGLWAEIQSNPEYRDKTTLFVMPEFGRDLDGSPTNGFFNHRLDSDSTRLTWMMCLGAGARHSNVIEQPVRLIDVCPTIAGLYGVSTLSMQGRALPEIRL